MWGCLWRSVRTLRLDQLTLTLLLLLLWWTPNVHRLICSSRQAQQWTYYHPATWWDVAATLQCCCWAVSWLWIVDQTHQQNLIWGKQVCYTTAVPSDRKQNKKKIQLIKKGPGENEQAKEKEVQQLCKDPSTLPVASRIFIEVLHMPTAAFLHSYSFFVGKSVAPPQEYIKVCAEGQKFSV